MYPNTFRETPFTVENGLQYQAQDLAEWKTKLNEKCYAALEVECKRKNMEGCHIDGYSIFRGQDMNSFIKNWKP